jgi:RND family efflux transporter MFP subunit
MMCRKMPFQATTLATVMLIAATNCGGDGDQANAAEERVIILGEQDVAAVRRSQVSAGTVLTGSLQPGWVVNVKAQVAGTIAGIHVDRGVAVRRGQALASIRAEGIRGQAEGARAGVAAAEANLAVAEQRLASARTLREAGAIAEIDLKAATAGYEAARAQVAAAKAAAAGALESAGHATVRAPITGIVSARRIEVGEAISSGDELFTVVRSDYLELSGNVAVEQAARIKPGQPAVFALDAYPDRRFRGAVARIDPMADPATRQVGVYLRMPNPGGLVGGQFASGRILTGASTESLVIPQSSVRSAGGELSVLVVENGRAVKRMVTLGMRDVANGTVEVKSGLQADELVIALPSASLEGARVQIGATATPAATERQ